jgi:hypothetical protein
VTFAQRGPRPCGVRGSAIASVRGPRRTARKLLRSDLDSRDSVTHWVEGTAGKTKPQYRDQIYLPDLRGLLGLEVPKGFQLTISAIKGRWKGLDSVCVTHTDKGLWIAVNLFIAFETWEYRTNLAHFAEEFRASLEQTVPNCQAVTTYNDEYGVHFSCRVRLELTEDVFAAVQRTDDRIYELYLKAVANADAQPARPPSQESGFRWWVEKLIVPIVTALIGAFVGYHAKK